MKKNLSNIYGLKKPFNCFQKLLLTLKITSLILICCNFNLSAISTHSSDNLELQQETVSGKVTDSQTGQNLPGVNIHIKGTTQGVITGADGKYSIAVPDKNAVLVFSFIGYISKEVTFESNTIIDVVLESSLQNLDEVVVIGYGTQKKTSITGSVSITKGDELSKVPVGNISQSITGKLSGVTMLPNGGTPGNDDPQIFIRGIGTTGSKSPLIVIDGIIRNNIGQVDPSIIESVTVLKDAAAVAPFGLGGANGVILITTKKGETGAPTLSLNSYYGVQTPDYYPKLLHAKDYMSLSNEAYLNEFPGGTSLPFAPDVIANYNTLHAENPDLYPDSNPRDLVHMVSPVQNHNLQLTGGTDRVKYFVEMGYFKQNGMFDKVDYTRFNYNINLELKVTKTTKVSLFLINSEENTNDLDAASSARFIFRSAYKYIPTQQIYYTNGLWGQWAGNSPVGVLNSGGYQHINHNNSLRTITLEQELPFIKGLSVKGTVSYDGSTESVKGWHRPIYYWEQNTNTTPYTYTKSISNMETDSPPFTYLKQSQTNSNVFTYQGYVNYVKSFGFNVITGLFVVEARSNNSNDLSASRNNFAVNIDEMDMGSSDKNDFNNGGSSSEGAQIGYVYRLGYVYKDKYMLEASGRYDGHYYFAPGKRWGYFPAFSIGWKLSEEKFMKDLSYINNLKIRGSWGKSGNLAGSPYQYLSGYDLYGNAYAFGTGTMVQGAVVTGEANHNITWEISTKTDIGFEAALWNSLLKVEADYFFERRTGMLLAPNITVPLEYGLSLSQENAGEMKNSGFEVTVGSRYKLQNGLRFGFDGILSFAKNKMIQVFETSATYNNPNRRVTGRPFETRFGYHSLGLFSTNDDKNGDGIINSSDGYNVTQFGELHPGDIRYEDISGPNGVPDGIIDENDEVPIGYPNYPLMSFGFTPTADWKGFDLSLFFQGSAMVSNYLSNFQTVPFKNDKSNTDYEYFNNRWTPETQNAKYPRAMGSPDANNSQGSDFWMVNTSYLRLKNCTFGYTLPASVTKFLKISIVRVYFSGLNLFTLSKLKYNDPEMADPGMAADEISYPIMKSYSFGVNATF